MLWQVLILIVFGLIVFNFTYVLMRLYEIYIMGNTGNPFTVIQFITTSAFGIFLVLAIGGFQMGMFYFMQWQKSQLETERLQREQTEALFQNLKHQISPHFLLQFF